MSHVSPRFALSLWQIGQALLSLLVESLMKSWHELDDRVWFSWTNCRVMNFILLLTSCRCKVTKNCGKRWEKKKPKTKRIWSFCAALQVVGPKPARSFIWHGFLSSWSTGGEVTSSGFRKPKAKVFSLSRALSYSPLHLWHCIFKALSCTCADNVLPSQQSRLMDPRTDCPRARISVTCQTLLAFVPRPQKSASGAYKLITCCKRFEWVQARPQHKARHGELNGFGFGFESVSLSLSLSLTLSLSPSASSFFSSRTRRFYDIPILT